MALERKLIATIVAVTFVALIVPAFAQNGSTEAQRYTDRGMSMGHMDHEMMGGGMMTGCAGMMQSNGSNGRPNSQWQR